MKRFLKTMVGALLGIILTGSTVIITVLILTIIVSMVQALLGG